VDLDEILYGGDGIEDNLDSILLNPVASTIRYWTFKLQMWVQLLNRLVNLDEILCGGDDIEYCLLYAYVGKVGILVLPRTSCYFPVFGKFCSTDVGYYSTLSNNEAIIHDSLRVCISVAVHNLDTFVPVIILNSVSFLLNLTEF
jgi:hypothetical protein